jgi:hypothetical protein
MTFPSDGPDSASGLRPPRTPSHYVVIVEEHIERQLAGRAPCFYVSPPQPRMSALALVGLLLGRAVDDARKRPWRSAIAGGEREIRVLPSRPDGQVGLPI